MSKEFYRLVSDSEILDEMADSFRNRILEQKFLYTEDGANAFYSEEKWWPIFKPEDVISTEDYIKILEKNVFKKWKKYAFVSLACGDSHKEKEILKSLLSKWFDISYYWVDFSERMLELSEETLKNINCNKKFILADIWSKKFKTEIDYLLKDYDERVFTFYGNTFWNINYTNIIDILGNLLKKWEKLLLEVVTRKDLSIEESLFIFNRNKAQLNNEDSKSFLLNKIRKIWIKDEDGKLIVTMKEDKLLDVLKVNFIFEILKKIKIDFRWKMVFLPWEKIELYTIYYYYPETLISFFKEHDFKFLDASYARKWWQFLFEKE